MPEGGYVWGGVYNVKYAMHGSFLLTSFHQTALLFQEALA